MPVGPTELVVVLLIVLAVFGAGKLPDVGRGLGRSIREFRESTRDYSPSSPPDDDSAAR